MHAGGRCAHGGQTRPHGLACGAAPVAVMWPGMLTWCSRTCSSTSASASTPRGGTSAAGQRQGAGHPMPRARARPARGGRQRAALQGARTAAHCATRHSRAAQQQQGSPEPLPTSPSRRDCCSLLNSDSITALKASGSVQLWLGPVHGVATSQVNARRVCASGAAARCKHGCRGSACAHAWMKPHKGVGKPAGPHLRSPEPTLPRAGHPGLQMPQTGPPCAAGRAGCSVGRREGRSSEH